MHGVQAHAVQWSSASTLLTFTLAWLQSSGDRASQQHKQQKRDDTEQQGPSALSVLIKPAHH
eukprot:1158818-Pelagomonas_calceolata.AAC.8